MSDASQREWRFYVDDMIDFAGKVLAYTDGLDQAGFVASGLVYDATLRNPRETLNKSIPGFHRGRPGFLSARHRKSVVFRWLTRSAACSR